MGRLCRMVKTYVVYIHINNKTGDVFYVGKGTYGGKVGYDRPIESSDSRRNEIWHKYVKDIDNDFTVKIVKELECEDDAFEYEKELQKHYWSIGQASCSLLHGEEWDRKMKLIYSDDKRNRKISEKLKGRPKSEELKKKISHTLKGVYCRENNSNKRKVKQYTLDNEFVKEYSSLSEGARAVGGHAGHICKVCNGEMNKHKGFIWRYSEGENPCL